MGTKLYHTLFVAASLPALAVGCASTTKQPAKPSWTEQISASVKSGTAKMTALVTRKSEPATSEKNADHKPGPSVMVALGQVHERSGNLEEAEIQYGNALKADPNHLGALLLLAHLEDARGHFEAATKLYRRALKKHSKEPAVHNDLGLCYLHQHMLPEAVKSFQTAIELQPARKLYHDNLATALVEQGKTSEALKQLVEAHGEAVGNYNLGYLYKQKHNNDAALVHFQKALSLDPTLGPARQWVAQLSAPEHRVESLPPLGASVATAQQPAVPPVAQPEQREANVASFNPPVTAPERPVDSFIQARSTQTTGRTLSRSVPARSESDDLQFKPNPTRGNTADAELSVPDQAPGDGRLPAVSFGKS